MKRFVYLLTTLLALTLLSACVTSAPATDSSATAEPVAESGCVEGFRLFVHSAGESCVPENPQRIVTTQDQNALLPLLELAIKPVGSAGQPLDDGDFRFRRVEGFDTEGIEFVGSYGEPNLESIALLQPDLIIGPPFQSDIYDSLSAIAPTVLIDVHNRPLDEALMDFATLVNAEEQATALKVAYEAHAAEFLAALGDRREQITISVITPGGETGQFYNEAASQATGTVMQALGLLRPAPEAGPEAIGDLRSVETLPEHDADVMIIISYTGEDQDPLFAEFLTSPILNNLGVAQAEQVYVFDGLSMVGAGWSKMDTFIDELERVLLNPDLKIDVVQEVQPHAPLAATERGAANCTAGERLFDHELLATDPICIPENPQRIIALDVASVELTLMTGKTLLATSGWLLSEMPILLPQFADTLAEAEDVGYPANLETILLLKPDLILAVGGTSVGETIDVEQAMQIAPVVIADPAIYADWKLGTGFWSEVLTVADFYATLEENYFTRVSELQAALGNPGDLEVSIIAASTYGISLWMPDTPPGQILSDVGLARPEAQSLIGEEALARYAASQYITISEERLDLIDGDAIFYFTYASANPETAQTESAFLQSLAEKPLWQALDAVKAGKAFLVPGYWWRSQSYLLANLVLDDLFVHLTDTTATTPVLAGQSTSDQ